MVQYLGTNTLASPLNDFRGLDTAEAVKQRKEWMVSDRWRLEAIWRDITALFYPAGPRWEDMESRGGRTIDPVWQEARTARRGRKIYDSTAITASERLASGIESMITPQAQTWHNLQIEDRWNQAPDYESEAWIEAIVDYLFKSRYDPRSGFLNAHQNAIMSAVTLGSGVMFLEENYGTPLAPANEVPVKYISIPLNEALLGLNPQGEHDTCFRMFKLSARQAIERFGEERCSEKVKAKASSPSEMDERFDFLHAVYPAEQMVRRRKEANGMHWASMYIELDSVHEISLGGYEEFPYIVYPWNMIENNAYGESPAMQCISEAKTLQTMSRDALLASQNNIRPAVATAYGLDRPINLNPGQVNPKMVDPQTGRLLVQPIIPPANPQLMETTMEMRRNLIREAMYSNLFAVLADKPYQTATEASIRNAEKAELLGPAATRIQKGLSKLVEREIGILGRKGAFGPNSPLTAPQSVQGKDVNVRFTSPIDRARRISEVTGMQQTLEFAAGMAQFKPEVLENLDVDQMLMIARSLFGAPAASMKDPAVVAELRAQAEQMKQAAQMAQMAGGAGEAAKSVGEGMGAVAEGGASMGDVMSASGIDPSMLTGVPGAVQ